MPRSRAAESVREFHRAFDMPARDVPQWPPRDEVKLRIALLKEECSEAIWEMNDEHELALVAKELADVLYVVYGAAEHYGIPLDDVFDEVHRSNMSKVWDDGTVKKHENGKVMKPPTYSQADLTGIL